MTQREVRVSPDGESAGIRTEWPDEHDMAWSCIHYTRGGYWAPSARVADWLIVTATEGPPAPEPVEEVPIAEPPPVFDPIEEEGV